MLSHALIFLSSLTSPFLKKKTAFASRRDKRQRSVGKSGECEIKTKSVGDDKILFAIISKKIIITLTITKYSIEKVINIKNNINKN